MIVRTKQLAIDPARDKINNSIYKKYFEKISTRKMDRFIESMMFGNITALQGMHYFFEMLKGVYKVWQNRDTQIKRMRHENTLSGNFIIFRIIQPLRFIHKLSKYNTISLNVIFIFQRFACLEEMIFTRRQIYKFSVYFILYFIIPQLYFFYQADFTGKSLDARKEASLIQL